MSNTLNYHKLLNRQLVKTNLAEMPKDERYHEFLKLVDEAYRSFDEERILYRHSYVLSNRELLEANKQLTEGNNFLDTFNHGMAHDIKNHASNIIGLTLMLKKYTSRDDKEMTEKIIARLESSSRQLSSILIDFLYLSKSERSVSDSYTEIRSENLIELINIETEHIRKTADYELIFNFNCENLFYRMPVLKIILVNLISNSIKFAKSGSKAHVEVNLFVKQNELNLEVKDNGVGMDLKDESNRIFSLFSRMDRRYDISGTGVGLYVVKRIIDQNKGTVQIHSEPGTGTMFKIQLPLAKYEL